MPRLILWLALAHGLSDGASGWLLGTAAGRLPPDTVAWLFLVYNALAFGAQPLAGLLVDRGRRLTLAAAAGLIAVAAALLCAVDVPFAAAALAGCGSAFFHVSGGGIALRLSGNRAGAAGVFAAPGVIGLALGGVASATPWALTVPLAALIVVVAAVVALSRSPNANVSPALAGGGRTAPRHAEFDRHDLLMLALLAAIALRSFTWTLVQAIDAGETGLLLVIALAAAAGKAGGGWAADHVGWRRWTMGALLTATPLLALGGSHPAALAAGVMLLQSTTPVMLAMSGRLLPGSPATAAGLALGLGVALGGVPVLLGVPATLVVGSWMVPLVLTAACLLTLIAARPVRRPGRGAADRGPAFAGSLRVGVLPLLILLLAPAAEARADLLVPGAVPRVWCIGVANLDRFPETIVTGYGGFPNRGLFQGKPAPDSHYAMQIAGGKPFCNGRPFTPYLFVVPQKDFRPVNLPQNPTQVRAIRSAVEAKLGLTFPEMPRGVKETLDVLELVPAAGGQPTLRKRQVRYTFVNNTVEELPYGADGVRPGPSRIPPGAPAEEARIIAASLALDLIEPPSPASPTGVVALLALTGVILAVVIRRRRR